MTDRTNDKAAPGEAGVTVETGATAGTGATEETGATPATATPAVAAATAPVAAPVRAAAAHPASSPGVDTPDHRGRTGLDRAGRDLSRNPDVVVRDVELTSQGWHVLRRTTFDYRRRDGAWETQQRETYDRGNGAVVLPYDAERGCVLLTRQFRYPAYVNGHPDGMLVEAAAGLLDEDDPLTAVRREAAEELGVTLTDVIPVMDVYMSPGSVTERLHFYAAPYTPADRSGTGGGVAEEGEDIEVLEVPFAEALSMTRDGRVTDGKTVLLLQWAALDGPFSGSSAFPRPS